MCLARALRRRRHARCHTHRIQRAGTGPAPPSRCAGGRSRDARPQPIDHSRRQPEQRVAAHECGMPIRGPHKKSQVRPRTSQPRTLPSVGPVGRLYGFRAMSARGTWLKGSRFLLLRAQVSYSEFTVEANQMAPRKNAKCPRATYAFYSPGYHPCSALGFTLPLRTAVRQHAHKSPLVPALARASTPPVRPLLLQSAQVKACLGVAGVLEPRGPT